MTTIQIDDKTAAALQAQAQARAKGVSVEVFLRQIVENHPSLIASAIDPNEAVREFNIAMEELFATDRRPLPVDSSTHSRQDIYFDHD